MPLIDTHLHSLISYDGKDHRADLARTAAQLGIQALCFTDHYELVQDKAGLSAPWDWTETRKEHQAALALKDLPVELLYGIEIGNAHENPECARLALSEPGLDFAIGSIHFATPKLNREDHYFVSFTSAQQCRLYLDDYLTAIEEMVLWDGYDSVGHIPYPLRYMRERDGVEIGLTDFEDRLRYILSMVAQNGKAIEVNSCRSQNLMAEYGWLLGLFREEGGEYVTVGTDSHCCAHMGKGLAESNALLEANGFRYLTLFRRRKPCPIKL